MRKPPNIVFFCTDQQRWDQTGVNGGMVRTPTLDRLAGSGINFENHITPSPFCMPSRASIFTGRYPRNHKLWNHHYRLAPEKIATLPAVLAANGYRTHSCGKLHLSPWGGFLVRADTPEHPGFWLREENSGWDGPYMGFEKAELVLSHGFGAVYQGGHYSRWLREKRPAAVLDYAPTGRISDFIQDNGHPWRQELFDCFPMPKLDERDHYNSWIAERAAQAVGRYRNQPFFLWVSFPDPHHPFSAPAPYCDAHPADTVKLPEIKEGELESMPDFYAQSSIRGKVSETTLRRLIGQSMGMVEHIDACMGRVVAAIEDAGLADNTIFAFTSDHGEMLGHHNLLRKGSYCYRDLLRVPFVLSGKPVEAIRGRGAAPELTSHVDIMPTLLALCGISPPAGMDGISLAAAVRGEPVGRNAVFCEWVSGPGNKDQYQQTLFMDSRRLSIFPNRPDWLEFFDFSSDPGEHVNLARDPVRAVAAREMRERLEKEFPPVDEARDILPFYSGLPYYGELEENIIRGKTTGGKDATWKSYLGLAAALGLNPRED